MKKNNAFDYAISVICVLLLIGMTIFLAVNWKSIPDSIPGHYNAAGEVDRWANKSELFMLPITVWLLFGLLSVVEQFPSIWNTGVRVTEENKYRVYHILKTMLGLLKLEMTVMFVYMAVCQAMSLPLSGMFLPVTMVALFGTTALGTVALLRAR